MKTFCDQKAINIKKRRKGDVKVTINVGAAVSVPDSHYCTKTPPTAISYLTGTHNEDWTVNISSQYRDNKFRTISCKGAFQIE